MKKQLITLLTFLLVCTACQQQEIYEYDLVILGGTPGGITTAIAAAREGKQVVILERSEHIGGLPVNGLGVTDIATKGATTGLFKEFVDHILAYYVNTYGEDSPQARDCTVGYHFEPRIAARVFDKMLGEEQERITIRTLRQFNVSPENIFLEKNRIQHITLLNRTTGKEEQYAGKIFVDATYEGDLGGAAGVPFRIGREAQQEFNEPGAGKIYKLWHGPELEGSTFEADDALQAYNYRLCLTNDPEIRLLPGKPAGYNREEYTLLIEDVYLGRHAGVDMLQVTREMMEANKEHIRNGGSTQIPGDVWGMWKISSMTRLPNKKMDANNQHLALISTDLPEENQEWPTAGWEWRDQYAGRLKEYILGLLWFAQNDEELPEQFRSACREWGLATDEYPDNHHFPRQVYVREGRRFEGDYFFTAHDALPVAPGQRPPIHANSITASHYALDSHAVRKREEGKIALDGFFSYPTAVYTVPFGVIVPKIIEYLLIPVPVSGSHVGFSTLRMEPCWMALGQAAGIAASLAIENAQSIREINLDTLQSRLIGQKATLIYYKEITPEDPGFAMVQYMGLRGYLPDWEANLDQYPTPGQLKSWSQLSGREISPDTKTTREVLTQIYQQRTRSKQEK